MTINTENLLESIMDSLDRFEHLKTADIPNMDLYMDQVTTLMEKSLKPAARHGDEDKVLTKTMINNYAKNDLLPAPIKKKYSKEHLLLLTFIYYFKNIISMKDIETLLKPITESYFQSEGDINIARIYDEVCAFEKERTKLLQKDIELMYNNSMEAFADVDVENRDYLQFFSFICSLSLDVYVKQLLIEKLIDATVTPVAETKDCEKDKDKKKKE